MIKIRTEKDNEQGAKNRQMVCCPECGQKLTDVQNINGLVMLRIMCRRCKSFINIDIIGTI